MASVDADGTAEPFHGAAVRHEYPAIATASVRVGS
jgi:hypothetical protein